MTTLPLSLGPWGQTLEEMVQAARAAEDGGFTTVWTPELHRSAWVPASAMAAATDHIGVATGIAYAFTRSELTTALHALDLDELSGGRFVLGLGTGVKRLIEAWHNAEFGKPATHLRESVAAIRAMIAGAHRGDPMAATGEYVTYDIKGYERPFAPVRTSIPIYVGAVGPVMTRTAGEVADGWISHELASPRFVSEQILPNLQEGLRCSGRSQNDVTRVVSAVCMPHEDSRQAKRWAAGLVAFYASVRTYGDFFAFHGYAKEAAVIADHFRAGDVDAMIAACPDDMVDAFTFAGTPAEIDKRIGNYTGVADELKLTPPTHFVAAEVTRAAQSAILEMFAR